MRDLPSSIWAGRGLAYDEQCGLRRLSCAGGAEAMHGVQVWESVGAGQPTAQPPTAAQSAAAPRSVAVGDARANVPGNAVKPAKVLAKQQEKQSGVPGISWQISRFCWQLRWTEKDKKGGSARHIQNFTISSFMKQGLNEVEAEAAALEAAKAFRADLVARGRIKEKLRDESLTSDVPGVKFAKASKKWQVVIPKPGGGRIQGGCFKEKAEAEARALQLRELHGLQRTVKACASRDELRVFQPKVAFPGVTWHVQKQCWQARTSGSKSSIAVARLGLWTTRSRSWRRPLLGQWPGSRSSGRRSKPEKALQRRARLTRREGAGRAEEKPVKRTMSIAHWVRKERCMLQVCQVELILVAFDVATEPAISLSFFWNSLTLRGACSVTNVLLCTCLVAQARSICSDWGA